MSYPLKIYIDAFGQVGICEKFPCDERFAGLNEMLLELVNEGFYGDKYKEFKPGFYTGHFEIVDDHAGAFNPDSNVYMQIKNIEPFK